jgi:hypothetical protein
MVNTKGYPGETHKSRINDAKSGEITVDQLGIKASPTVRLTCEDLIRLPMISATNVVLLYPVGMANSCSAPKLEFIVATS